MHIKKVLTEAAFISLANEYYHEFTNAELELLYRYYSHLEASSEECTECDMKLILGEWTRSPVGLGKEQEVSQCFDLVGIHHILAGGGIILYNLRTTPVSEIKE